MKPLSRGRGRSNPLRGRDGARPGSSASLGLRGRIPWRGDKAGGLSRLIVMIELRLTAVERTAYDIPSPNGGATLLRPSRPARYLEIWQKAGVPKCRG